MLFFFFFKQKTAYEMRISDWSSDVCSSDLSGGAAKAKRQLSPSWRRSTTVPTPSTWPETMWPPSSSPSFNGRSKLTAWPACQAPMVVQARVSFDASAANQDRKSVVEGKRVSVRVDLGGRRNNKKKKKER